MSAWLAVSVLVALLGTGLCRSVDVQQYEQNPSVQLFRRYLRIDTSHPKADYSEAVEFWREQAASLALPVRVLEPSAGRPVVVITWLGREPALPALMLSSHMDVVFANESDWDHPPFGAHMHSEGIIYGRGTQDMKSVSIQYLEAIRRLRAENATFSRTIHITLIPDEEVWGYHGMKLFAASEDFAALNVGLALDEGMPLPNNTYAVFYADRTPRYLRVNCDGEGGHGSIMKKNTAGEKIRKVLDYFFDFRETQIQQVLANPAAPGATVVTINLTRLSGGIGTNILPTTLSAMFDIRVGPGVNEKELNTTITRILTEADCSHEYASYEEISPATSMDDSNLFWVAFKNAAEKMKLRLKPVIPSGSTDMRYLRQRGVTAFGFSPLTDIAIKAHDKNEFIPADMFLRGIDIYYGLIPALANS